MPKPYTQEEVDMMQKAIKLREGWVTMREVAERLGVADKNALIEAIEEWQRRGCPSAGEQIDA